MQRMICPDCWYSVGVLANSTWVKHTVRGTRIRRGARKDAPRCVQSGKRVVLRSAR